MSLRPVRGHLEARSALARARGTASIPRALLFHGAPGVGKQRMALWTAQLLLCERADASGPCGECKDCRLSLRLEHPDLHWFFPLARPRGSHTPRRLAEALEEARSEALAERREDPLWGVHSDEVRGLYLAVARTLRRQAHRKPAMSERQVFIVAEAEHLVPQASSPEAANALLKLLEEPPGATWFVLTSSRPRSLLPTIRSRTFPLHLAPLSREEVRRFLVEEAGAAETSAEEAARRGQGSIGRALDFLPRDSGDEGPLERLRRESFRILRAALEGSPGSGLALAHDYPVSQARGLRDRFAHLEEWLRDLGATAAGAEDRVLNQDALEYLSRVVREKGITALSAARAVGPVEEARRLAGGNVNPQLLVAGLVRELRETLLGRVAVETGSHAPGAGRR